MPKTNIYTTTNLKVDVVRKHNPTLSDMLPKANVRRIPTRHQAPATLLAIIFFIHNIPPKRNTQSHFPNKTWLKDTKFLVPNTWNRFTNLLPIDRMEHLLNHPINLGNEFKFHLKTTT
jgi:hypothetical protein